MAFPVTPTEIDQAADRIGSRVRATPLLELESGAFGVPLLAKLELLQHTGSFKPRGAYNRALSTDVPPAGLIAASGGNHGLAVAHVAATLGLRAEVFVPEVSSAVKVDRLGRFGPLIRVTVGGERYADAQAAADERATETGAAMIHPYDHPAVVAGQGTMARELDRQVGGGIDTLLVAVGGGGLIAGAACWFGTRVRIVAVEPRTSRALGAALDVGEPVDVDVSGVAADSLGARRVGDLAFAAAIAAGVSAVTVTDDDIVIAQRRLWDQLRLVAEPGGATALAAIVSGAYRPEPGERVAVVVCGANTDRPRSPGDASVRGLTWGVPPWGTMGRTPREGPWTEQGH